MNRRVSLAYNRGRRTGTVVELARAIALGAPIGLLMQYGIPRSHISRAQLLLERERARREGLTYQVLLSDGRVVDVPYRDWLRWPPTLRRVLR